ncbi:right-handed parallel beta-helix repeat-containing protein [Alkalihalobacillus sp. MEB130]|uniref:right-handed parallel beta-helix repeat-containing protein n=1 Tax=Alkalihalobacillus sp. MEB130 TaxID=2976704 RepID=UPI0028E09E2A|nr:right-handed parallel beta-helix repeat-containing protein [Alkalihalobacillus sp. MEB130]MDT8860325.1 right-handed parallel beta-helix repeat-containing protein [Alkalihalobacillus sp. MEB130]
MNRRNFLVNFLFWILSFFVGYKVANIEIKSEDASLSDNMTVQDKVDTLNQQINDTTRKLDYIINVKQPPYNVRGDAEDDTEAIQQAMYDAKGKELVIPDGEYAISSSLEIPDDIIITMGSNARLFTVGKLTNIFKCEGKVTGSYKVKRNLSVGERTIPVSNASAFSKGDLIMVRDDYKPDDIQPQKGECHYIHSVNKNNKTIELTESLWDSYSTDFNASVDIINPIKNIRITGGIIEGAGVDAGQNSGMLFKYVTNLEISHTTVRNWARRGIMISTVVYGKVEKCTFENIYDTGDRPGTGYSIELSNATQWFDTMHCFAKDVSKLWDVSGFSTDYGHTRFCKVAFNKIYGANRGCISTHAAGEHFSVFENDIYGSRLSEKGQGHGMMFRTPNMKIYNNRIWDSVRHGIECRSEGKAGSYEIYNNTIHFAQEHAIRVGMQESPAKNGKSYVLDQVVIDGNNIIDSGGYGIYIYTFTEAYGKLSKLSITNNMISYLGTAGIILAGEASGINHGLISGNTAINNGSIEGKVGILIRPESEMRGLLISNNSCHGGEYGIQTTSQELTIDCFVNGNLVEGTNVGVDGFANEQMGLNKQIN